MWLRYALLAALITGVGQVLVKKGQLKLPPFYDNLFAAILVNIILVPLLYYKGVELKFSYDIVIYALLVAVAYAAFYYIISFGEVSLMISLINTFPVVTIIFSVFFLKELPTLVQWLGIATVIVGVIFLSVKSTQADYHAQKSTWIIWGLLGSFAIGTAEFLTKLATIKIDGRSFTFLVYLMYLPPLFALFFLDKNGRQKQIFKNKISLIFTIVGVFLIEAGLIYIALAYQNGNASLVSPVISIHMIITAVLAALFLNETLTTLQIFGIIIDVIGVMIIGFAS